MRPPTRLKIAREVCNAVGVAYTGDFGVQSTRRSPNLVIARALIVHMGKLYDYSYTEITPYAGYTAHSGAQEARGKLLAGNYGDGWKKIAKNIQERIDISRQPA